jgi:8-oxo-dGTP diphosphatase
MDAMLIDDKYGNQLLELIKLNETDLSTIAPLTHALVVARQGTNRNLLVFSRDKQHWEVPGGMINPGETPRTCAVRELREESGINCAADDLRFVGAMKFLLQANRFHADVRVEYGALYVVEIDPSSACGPFVPNDEISKVCWWDGRESIGEISAIDRKLTELL